MANSMFLLKYQAHIRKEAKILAQTIVDSGQLEEVYRWFLDLSLEEVRRWEMEEEELIAEYIELPEARREPYLRRINADIAPEQMEFERAAFLVMCLIGLERTGRMFKLLEYLDLRPGRGLRIMSRGVYALTLSTSELFEYQWPKASFEAVGVFLPDAKEEDEDDG